MRLFPTFALAALALLPGTPSIAAEPSREGTFSFRFNPPEGVVMRLRFTLERARRVPGEPVVRSRIDTETEGSFRRVGDTFVHDTKPISLTMQRDGQTVDDPLVTLLMKRPMTYVLSSDGEVRKITGYEEIASQAKASLPPRLYAATAGILNPEGLTAQLGAEWDGRFSDFTRRPYAVGESFDDEAEQPLPTGESLRYTVRTSFQGWEPCPAGRCMRVHQAYESDGAALKRMVQRVVDTATGAASAPRRDAASKPEPGSRVTGSLTRLVDPDTMLVYSERIVRTMTVFIQGPVGAPRELEQEEVRTYQYDYR